MGPVLSIQAKVDGPTVFNKTGWSKRFKMDDLKFMNREVWSEKYLRNFFRSIW